MYSFGIPAIGNFLWVICPACTLFFLHHKKRSFQERHGQVPFFFLVLLIPVKHVKYSDGKRRSRTGVMRNADIRPVDVERIGWIRTLVHPSRMVVPCRFLVCSVSCLDPTGRMGSVREAVTLPKKNKNKKMRVYCLMTDQVLDPLHKITYNTLVPGGTRIRFR
jgi:hypothetical protein